MVALVAGALQGQEVETNRATVAGSIEYHGCYATWTNAELIVGNSRCERKWTAQGGRLKALSFRTKQPELEWLAVPAEGPHG